jgi:hypothetical protein
VTYDIVSVSGKKATIKPHAGQLQAWDSDRRFVFVIAGTQSGKTSFGPWWLYREIKRCGDGDYLAVTATYDLFKLKMLPEMQRVFIGMLTGWSWLAGERVITDGKSRIILRSANTPEGLESATAKAAWLDECGQDNFRLESWEAVQRRLSLYQGRVLGTTTPYNMGWLKTQVYDRWRNGDTDFQVIQFKSTMNPAFPVEEYERAKSVLPAWKFNMFYNGEFTRPAGMIYECFDEKLHKVTPFEIPAEWPRYVGVDFGAVNTALIWLAEDVERKAFYVYRDYLQGNRTTNEHARIALEYAEKERVVKWAGGAKSEKQQRWDWNAAGVPLQEPVISDVEAGIDRVIALFKKKQLFIFDTCAGLLDEIGTYARVLDDMGQPTDKIKDKETFHRLDGLRYVVQHIDYPTGAGLVAFSG